MVRQARRAKHMTRRQLVSWICLDRMLEMTRGGAFIILRSLEVDGHLMNDAVLRRILVILNIPCAIINDLLATAKAADAAAFAADVKRFAQVVAKVEGRQESKVMIGLTRALETQHGRPMA